MALVNCTINSSQVTVAKGSQIGSGVSNQILTIVPNTGFVVRASDFTAASPPTGISSIVLTNSGTAYATDNTIIVTCDLTDTGLYNANTDFTIDIDGSAILEKDTPKTLAGAVTTTTTNASGAASNVAYTATDTTGTTKDLFTKTVTANSSFFFSTEPTISVTTGDINNYSITSTTTNDGSGNLNSKTFNVDGIIPLENDLNDVIAISAVASAVPVATNNIKSYSFDTSATRYTLTKRTFKAYGDVGAGYVLTVTRTGDTHTYDFTTQDFTSASTNSGTKTIPSNGFSELLFTFPTVTADVTYTFTLTAVSPTTLALTQTHPFTVSRVNNKSVTVNATSTSRGTFQSKTITYTNYAGTAITQSSGTNATFGFAGSENNNNNEAEFNFNIVIDDDQAFTFSGSNSLLSSMSLTDSHFSISGDADIASGTATARRAADSGANANQLLTIAGSDWYNYQQGLNNTVITFNIDEFCDEGGSNPGGSNVLTVGSTQFQDITGGNTAILYPSGFIQQVSGRASGSTTVTYTLSGVNLQGNDFPSYVNTVGDVTVTAGNYSNTTTKFNSATYSTSITSFTVSNPGTSSRSLLMDVTVTITSFSPAVASGDNHNLKVMIAFANDGANP